MALSETAKDAFGAVTYLELAIQVGDEDRRPLFRVSLIFESVNDQDAG